MKSFSELTSASQVNNDDLMAISQTSGSGYASKKTTVKDITDKSNLNLADEYDSTSTYAVDDYVIYESVLYKCIGTTTGTFDSTKWTSVVVTDEMGSGGGGTGGHTIIDENGTSMTARAGLQFFGAVEVTDDSANNRTLVEVLGGDFYNPIIYSFDEREIGVWTDGKPLYEKTFDLGSDLAVSYNSWTLTSISLANNNIERLVKLFGGNSGGNAYYGDLYGGNNNGVLQVQTGRNGNTSNFRYITIQYTKTTDTAGSGTWTPQGVPTHKYSTEEQVVGTWIDGSTLYEKTFDVGQYNVTLVNNAWNNVFALSNVDYLAQAIIHKNSPNTNHGLRFQANNGYIQGAASQQVTLSSLGTFYVTFQYTKSS